MDHAAKHSHFDFELLRIFGAASFQRQATMRAGLLSFRQVNELLTSGQVAVITAPGSGLTGLSPALTLGRIVGRVVKLVGAVATRLLLGAASKTFGLQLANLTAKLFVFLFQRRDTPHSIGVSALPIPGPLAQFQILTPQAGHLGAQLIHFRPHHQRSQLYIRGDPVQKGDQHAIHSSCVVPSNNFARKDRLAERSLPRTGWAVVYEQIDRTPYPGCGTDCSDQAAHERIATAPGRERAASPASTGIAAGGDG